MVSWLAVIVGVAAVVIGTGIYFELAWYWITLLAIGIPLLGIAYVVYKGYQKIKPKPQTDIPCPPFSHPVLGHPDRMLSPLKHELRLEVCDAARSMYHQLVFMNQSSVFINDAEEVYKVITNYTTKGDIYKVFRLNPDIPDVLASDGEESLKRRKAFTPALASSLVDRNCITALQQQLNAHADNKKSLDSFETFSYFAFDAMSMFLFEYDLGAQRGTDEGVGLYNAIRTLTEAQAKTGIYADPNARTVSPDELKSAQQAWRDYLVKMSSKCTDTKPSEKPRSDKFTHALQRLASDSSYTDKHLAADIHQVFRHGYECLTGTLMWVFFALAKHPKVRTRLQGDISAFKAQAKTGCPEYLECFLKETLRRYPVAGNTTVRTVTEPHAELTGGAKVAQGTPLHLHIWSLQNTKREWDKPKEFLPDRWIDIVETTDDDGEKTIAYPKCPFSAGDTNVYNGAGHTEGSLSFLPFSAGERSCLGQTMVLSVLREVLLSMDDLRLDFVDKVWAEDLGISQNAIVIPQLPQSRTFRVFRGSAVAEDKVDEGWADEDE